MPVVAIDIGPAGGKVAMIVRADNIRMGEDACKWLGKAVGGKGKVLSLMGDQATINGRDRTTGFNDCMKKDSPTSRSSSSRPTGRPTRRTAAAQTVVTATPDLDGIYMQSDSVMLAGVLNVLKSADALKPVGEEGHIPLISIDAHAVGAREDPRRRPRRRRLAAARPLREVRPRLPAGRGRRQDASSSGRPTTTARSST